MNADASLADITLMYETAVLASMDLTLDQADRPQTLLRVEADRAGSGLAVAYHVRSTTVIRSDPALATDIEELADPTKAIDSDGFEHWATERGWRFVDGGDHHLVDRAGLVAVSAPSSARLGELDRDSVEDRRVIGALLARSDADDVEEAEFALDDLDPHILGLFGDDDELRAMVSGRVWDVDESFDDIGILVDDDFRGHGWGSAAVAAFCQASFDRGRLPLYRCGWSRTASKALALSLGFVLVGQVSAVGPAADQSSA